METEKMLNAMCELLPVQRNRLSHRKAKFLVVARAGDHRLAHTKQIPRSRSAFKVVYYENVTYHVMMQLFTYSSLI